MKIGILQCDHVLEKLQPEFGDYPQMFTELMKTIDSGLELQIYNVQQGEYPADIDECDGYITTGSRHGVNDDLEWLKPLLAFMHQLDEAGKKFVGICFGHQLIAKAFGGKVEKSDKGWGVGVSFNEVLIKKPWMEPWQEGLDLVVSHQDQVSDLPEDTEILAASNFCPYYMILYKNNFLSVQGHPEFSRDYSKALTGTRLDRIPSARVREAYHSLTAPVDAELMTTWILNFFRYPSR